MDADIVCTGRAVDDTLTPIGEPCGRRFVPYGRADPTEQARAAGWAVAPGPTYTCPQCRRPPQAAIDLQRTVQKGHRT